MSTDLVIRNMNRVEVDKLVAWAAREGWNPGLHDADVFWANDPDAFIAAELGGELIGGGAITSYGGEFGFMGFFIVRPEFRGRGFGGALWRARRDRLLGRLRSGATIGLDGVFELQDYYASGGFVFSHRSMRFRGEIPAARAGEVRRRDTERRSATSVTDDRSGAAVERVETAADRGVVQLTDVPLEHLLAYDRTCFPAPRPTFLREWIAQPDALALGRERGGKLAGYGVVRRCGEGCKVGPLFADDAEVAEVLYAHLAPFAAGGPLFLDAPENNPAAIELVRRHGMMEVFGCARMYLGPPPDIAHDRVFGVTTFELG